MIIEKYEKDKVIFTHPSGVEDTMTNDELERVKQHFIAQQDNITNVIDKLSIIQSKITKH